MPLKINLKTVILYAVFGIAMLAANCAVKGVPLSLGIAFAMLLCGMSVITTPILFVLASIVHLDLLLSLISLFAGAFLSAIAFLYRRTGKKIKLEALLYVLIALAPYVAFAPWLGGDFIIDNGYALRAIASAVVLIFGFFCFKTVYAVLYRVQRARLKEDELVCIAVVFAVCGAGAASLCGIPFYLCFSAGITVFAVRLTRSPAAIIIALVTALPCACIRLSAEPLTAFVIISSLSLLFSGAGRFACGAVTASVTAVYMY
ncbi:MAG: hypothetical protein K2N30_01245, partial [Clostridia bacterium]|nr:hypothetical protein [Clostridia bacterium]